MSNSNQSAFEWFFQNYSSTSVANLPFNPDSGEFSQIQKGVDRLSMELGSIESPHTESKDFVIKLERWAKDVNKSDDPSSVAIRLNELLDLSEEINAFLDEHGNKSANSAFEFLQVDLVKLAKSSKDIDFRKKIISFIEKLLASQESSAASER